MLQKNKNYKILVQSLQQKFIILCPEICQTDIKIGLVKKVWKKPNLIEEMPEELKKALKSLASKSQTGNTAENICLDQHMANLSFYCFLYFEVVK